MKIEMIAHTNLLEVSEDYIEFETDTSPAEDLSEFAGRACYQSFHKPNEATRANKDYLANILAQGHESVLEHSSASFYVQGVSRNMLLELERHRHLSFSVISTRFVNSESTDVVIPPGFGKVDYTASVEDAVWDVVDSARDAYRLIFDQMIANGATRKEAREAARAVLPGNLETKFVVTGNMRAWRDVLKKRYSVHADAEIREFASEVLMQLRDMSPNVFQDFPDAPYA